MALPYEFIDISELKNVFELEDGTICFHFKISFEVEL